MERGLPGCTCRTGVHGDSTSQYLLLYWKAPDQICADQFVWSLAWEWDWHFSLVFSIIWEECISQSQNNNNNRNFWLKLRTKSAKLLLVYESFAVFIIFFLIEHVTNCSPRKSTQPSRFSDRRHTPHDRLWLKACSSGCTTLPWKAAAVEHPPHSGPSPGTPSRSDKPHRGQYHRWMSGNEKWKYSAEKKIFLQYYNCILF